MDIAYTEEQALQFLDYAAEKGLINPSTANARKVALQKVLKVLSDDEKVDLRQIDRDDAFKRFMNLHKQDFTPDSLTTYRQRFGSALDDFIAYVENPAGFRPVGSQRASRAAKGGNGSPGKTATVMANNASRAAVSPPVPPGLFTFPVPLPSGGIAQLNLPHKITTADAERISAVVKALAIGQEGE